MSESRILKNDLFRSLPEEWPKPLRGRIRERVEASGRKVVVLDDDPTGTQTVHHVPVLTTWSVDALASELSGDSTAFYVLTNSRSLPAQEAFSMYKEIGRNLLEAARRTGCRYAVVSRSDSTLRGHFPQEMEALGESLKEPLDGWVIIPFFLEGGRFTVNDVHYAAEGKWLIPAAETEFARDAVFGYRASDLRHWVEEKTRGRIRAKEVFSLSMEDIRMGGPGRVATRLKELHGGVCIVNAAGYGDLEVFTLGLLDAEESGRKFLFRTAASFVQVRAGLDPRPLLCREDFKLPKSGAGLVVVGSYVSRTTEQLRELLSRSDVASVEIPVESLLDDLRRLDAMKAAADTAACALREGKDTVLFTSRGLVTGKDPAGNLSIGRKISEALVSVIRMIPERPRYILAKGGITSSDVATKGLDVKRAMVLGQILPGVPVWQLDVESRYPGLFYIVFPGNVGDSQSLCRVVEQLKTHPKP